ncbi:hypothetical protein A464_3328 [Salmonella bongori N268-08]|uniref:Uncharacterized protein n=1 Tax=Salmonella bongori N268-08 TaxID=1197719 RepID=S5NJS3_SALBN|nr:hypothetical protein A464_3328 [Salmonella bongori N268-08]
MHYNLLIWGLKNKLPWPTVQKQAAFISLNIFIPLLNFY